MLQPFIYIIILSLISNICIYNHGEIFLKLHHAVICYIVMLIHCSLSFVYFVIMHDFVLLALCIKQVKGNNIML